MNEWIMILVMAFSGIAWAIGGTGFKWVRRYVLPIFFFFICFLSGVPIAHAMIVCLLSIGAYSMGYGESKPYWYKFLVGVAWIAPTLIFGMTLWQIITPIAWIVMFKLSNTSRTANDFRWKVVEFITGTMIGITYINAIL